MITPKKVEEMSMTPEKRKSAKYDIIAFYIGRPLSYILTVPFLYTNLSPNSISLISIIPVFLGFVLMAVGTSKVTLSLGWLCFVLWNLLDGVDGNVARYKKISSKLGSVYDAMSGYFAMVLTFFACGVAAVHNRGVIDFIPCEYYAVLGGLSGVFVIFPRLVMHKVINMIGDAERTNQVKDKTSFSLAKIVVLNIVSINGFAQIFMLIAVIFNLFDLFTIIYFIVNTVVMCVSLKTVLRDK
jgi:phosphatidylglycerophosphate synthase